MCIYMYIISYIHMFNDDDDDDSNTFIMTIMTSVDLSGATDGPTDRRERLSAKGSGTRGAACRKFAGSDIYIYIYIHTCIYIYIYIYICICIIIITIIHMCVYISSIQKGSHLGPRFALTQMRPFFCEQPFLAPFRH